LFNGREKKLETAYQTGEAGMALRSKFKFNEKLRNCEIKDTDHIGQFTFPVADRQGEHVRLIHEALNAFLNGKERFDTITGPEFDNKTFGTRTAQVVREFKTEKRLLNFQNQIDEIVGKKTVVELDKELPPADPGPGPNPTQTFIDVVVRFLPGVHGEQRDDAALEGIDMNKINRRVRTIKGIGRGTSLIREAARPLVLSVAKNVEDARKTDGFSAGIVCIYGSSSGGRVSLDLASELTSRGIPIAYIGIQDAAFFPNETTSVPLKAANRNGNDNPEVSNTPEFLQTPTIVADTTRSFFQRWGNHIETIRSRWTSKMDFKEIHGNVIGFEPVDRSVGVKESVRDNDDLAHDEVVGNTNAEVQREIQAKLAAQTPVPPPL
jgi:hypothetical protein